MKDCNILCLFILLIVIVYLLIKKYNKKFEGFQNQHKTYIQTPTPTPEEICTCTATDFCDRYGTGERLVGN